MKLLLLFLVAGFAAAQSNFSGHAFYAPTLIESFNSYNGANGIGGGVDAVFWRGLGFAADTGWFFPGVRAGDGVGLASLNGVYHFARREKVDPFVTGGYGLLFRSATVNMANFGGGVNWWFHDKLGLGLEVRDHLTLRSRNQHFISFRFGLAFR